MSELVAVYDETVDSEEPVDTLTVNTLTLSDLDTLEIELTDENAMKAAAPIEVDYEVVE